MSFQRLVRFAHKGQASFGELLSHDADGFRIQRLDGHIWTGLKPSDEVFVTSELLCPIDKTPIIICVGLNYQQHAKEANLPVPTYPVTFTKPADSLAGPFDAIPIHPACQAQLDYEGELCVIIGRDAKNVSEEDALEYVFGYCIGNDVSARNFQIPEASGGQFCYAKSFDKFAPIGPAIWSRELIPDPQVLEYETIVDGEVEQKTSTDDMIWSVRQLIAHLSRGTTLRQGTVIMAGTPSGVGYFKNKFLRDGSIVKVEVKGLGGISNTMKFE